MSDEAPRTRILIVEDDPNIVDLIRSNLAVRGFVKIQEEDRRWWEWSRGYVLTRLSGPTDAKPYEQKLLDTLFAGSDTFSARDLRKDPVRSRALYKAMTKL